VSPLEADRQSNQGSMGELQQSCQRGAERCIPLRAKAQVKELVKLLYGENAAIPPP